jgi:dTDP-4-dehydrorhamnose reductase
LFDLLKALRTQPQYIINAIGIIKPRIREGDSVSLREAITINSLLPYHVAEVAASIGAKVIQIATDCVYSGLHGGYTETSAHDALDVYGKTKSLGEVSSPHVMNLRCSIVGPEVGRSTSLWEWAKGQPLNHEIEGFVDHLWNGVTTDAFAEVCRAAIENQIFFAGTSHLVPADRVSKYELLQQILARCERTDVRVIPTVSGVAVDRTLASNDNHRNLNLWANTSYSRAPKIAEMIGKVVL